MDEYVNEYQILIVDNDPNQLKIITGYLIENNPDLKLLISTNGKSAYEIARRNKPDLILMDWEMPVMNGIDSIKLLKADESTMEIPVIMITGAHNDTDRLKEALDSGAIDFLNKPFNSIELIARINTQLRNIEIFRKLLSQKEVISNHEKELIAKEKLILQAEVLHQQKQLTMNTVNILKQAQQLQSITEEITALLPHSTEEGKRKIKSIISMLNDRSSERMWNEFEACFEKVHSGFYEKLVEKIPDITMREKRLCAFLKMNMSTKEIASISFQSPNSIDVGKHRLRKKVKIQSDEDFTNFIISL